MAKNQKIWNIIIISIVQRGGENWFDQLPKIDQMTIIIFSWNTFIIPITFQNLIVVVVVAVVVMGRMRSKSSYAPKLNMEEWN